MNLWQPRSISGKLTRMNLLVSGTALLLAYIAFLGYDFYTLRQALIASLSTEADILGANSIAALMFDDQQAAENTLSALQRAPQIQWALIVRSDGRRFAQYLRDSSMKLDLRVGLMPGESSEYWTRGRTILLGKRIDFQGKAVGAVYLLAETGQLRRGALQFGLLSAGILALCFVLALLATSAMRHLVTDPLTGLAETAQIVSKEKDYSLRARIPRSSDELTLLVQSFNEMLEQIQQRDRALEVSRRMLEQKVRERTAELTAANKELEAFSYSVAHDLRGPLQQTNNIAYLLQMSMPESAKLEDRELMDKLLDGTQRMSALIDDLLNLSRATSTPLRRTAIDLSHMVAAIVESFKAEEGARIVNVSIAKGARAIADEGLVHVALENLLGNAWKYTSKRNAAEVTFGFNESAAGPIYFVRDNGAGFDPRFADRLFRPFQRLHSQNEFNGTGIGLATAYRIIARHGGKIWAEGKVDQGATFFFTLPYEAEK
jgi:signal transduction histidine kinase